jgi:hypothetical protein
VATIVLFGLVYYYLQLFSDGKALAGMDTEDMEKHFRYGADRWPERIIYFPSGELVIDCLYFSTITIATVGYGDIRPVSLPAKVAVMVEVVAGFLLIVVSIGTVIGSKKE